ncbi:AMP-dependent synthetase and ligase, partial [Setomelanomma holmii]
MPQPVERCVHDLVLDKMAAQPTAPAISAWDGEMTYGELEVASRRLAHHLLERGVGPEVMVGLCMDKSKWGVVAMLAILRAGGAVVPLGVQHPLSRIQGIVNDTAAPLVLVDRSHEQRLAELTAHTQLLAVDSFFDDPSTVDTTTFDELCPSVRPEHVAWVIYTSGSTGTPKGVMLEHSAIATSILGHGHAFGIKPHDRLSQFAAYTFDVAIQEITTTLALGACICVPSEDDRVNRLTPYLAEARVTIATLTSTVAALVQPQDTPTVRTLVLMGEAVQAKVVDQWIEHADIINAYGP